MEIRTVGVVGAGVMGAGVAQVLAQTGHRVTLLDITDAALQRALAGIKQGVRLHKMLSPGAGTEPVSGVLGRITCSLDYSGLAEADFIVENVTEKWDLKQEVWREIDAHAPERCVMAANTSAISITRIAAATRRPQQVLGLHFMNPVAMKPMVEIIRGFHTSDQTIGTARAFLAGMNKEGIVVRDMPGFVSNRVLMLTVNEAIWLIQDRVAEVADVDRLFRSCFGHKMGPLETADLIGLDTILLTLEGLFESYRDSKFRACPLLKQMVDAGRHGRKSGQGFYSYEGGTSPGEIA